MAYKLFQAENSLEIHTSFRQKAIKSQITLKNPDSIRISQNFDSPTNQ